ncbi:MAG: hypothetical protein KIH67_001990 [Candidatus Moranbacteria bacterium]|nr:hypothetical protein [Candidatus Moranbacteria bacterium]
MKFVPNISRSATMIALAASAVIASPVLAQSSSTVSVRAGTVISAVSDSRDIAMPAIPGGSVGFEADPSLFQGANLCVSGLDSNWAIKADGTLDTRDPARRASCAPISASGQASVPNPFGANAVPFIERGGRIIAWAGRNRLTGLSGS